MSLDADLRAIAREFAHRVRMGNYRRLERGIRFLGGALAPNSAFTAALKGHAKLGKRTGQMMASMRARRSPFDRIVLGGGVPHVDVALASTPVAWSKVVMILRGWRQVVTAKMQRKLRALGTQAGLWKQGVVGRSPGMGPFAVGKVLVQPPRPFVGIDQRTVDWFVDKATDAILRNSGYR